MQELFLNSLLTGNFLSPLVAWELLRSKKEPADDLPGSGKLLFLYGLNK